MLDQSVLPLPVSLRTRKSHRLPLLSSSLLEQTFEYCYAFFRQEKNNVSVVAYVYQRANVVTCPTRLSYAIRSSRDASQHSVASRPFPLTTDNNIKCWCQPRALTEYETLQMAGVRPRHVSEIGGIGEPVSLREPLRALDEGEKNLFTLQP